MSIPNMPRELTARETVADWLYLALQLVSKIAFILGALVGYLIGGMVWASAAIAAGFFIGFWMRHSMGLRGRDPNAGFFIRARERAAGSRLGVLEWFLEKLRGNEFSRAKCQAFVKAYDDAMGRIQAARNETEKQQIILELDRAIKDISYG